jgi:hypothetical protein
MWRRLVAVVAVLVMTPALAQAKLTLDVAGRADGGVDFRFTGSTGSFLTGSPGALRLSTPALAPLGNFSVDPFAVGGSLLVGAFGEDGSAARLVERVVAGPSFFTGGGFGLTFNLRRDPGASAADVQLPIELGDRVTWGGGFTLPAAAARGFAAVAAPSTGLALLTDANSGALVSFAEVDVSAVPLPAALPLLGTGLAALALWRRRTTGRGGDGNGTA